MGYGSPWPHLSEVRMSTS